MKAEIIAGLNGRGNVKLDGADVSNAIRGFVLESGVGNITMTLDLVILAAEVEADTVIVPKAYDLLVRLGWTPPDGRS